MSSRNKDEATEIDTYVKINLIAQMTTSHKTPQPTREGRTEFPSPRDMSVRSVSGESLTVIKDYTD